MPWKAVRTEATDSDQELLRLISRGNEDAFSVLYDRYQGPLYRFVWHMRGNAAIAEEIIQEVFLLVIRGPKNFDASKGSLASYLFGVARNLTRRSIEQSRSTMAFTDIPDEDESGENAIAFDPPDEQQDIFAEISQKQLIEYLQKAVLSLPEQYREIISLCDLEQMSYTDVAELLQCSPGTVASRLHRGRAMLKDKMRMTVRGSER